MANVSVSVADTSQENQRKKQAPTPKLMRITTQKNWSHDNLRITINAVIISERFENCVGRTINILNPSSQAIEATYQTDATGRVNHEANFNFKEVREIHAGGGKKKFLVELIAKIGPANKTIEKRVFEEVEVDIAYPAGDLEKGYWALLIRLPKHRRDLGLALFLMLIFYGYTYYAGQNFAFLTMFLILLGLILWWKRGMGPIRTAITLFLAGIMIFAVQNEGEAFGDPIKWGVAMSLVIGFPFYLLEELWRKPNGESRTNFYPIWPMSICAIIIVYLIFDILGSFIPKNQVYNIYDGSAFLNVSTPWNFLNNVPFLTHIDFHGISWNLGKILEFTVAGLILGLYGGSRELIDWFKSLKGNNAADLSGGGIVSIFYVLIDVFRQIKDFILPLLGLGGQRGRRK